jgi:hypothetical protein
MSKRIPIIVLNDGETWCTLDGVELYLITQRQLELLNDGTNTVPNIWKPHVVSVRDFMREHLSCTDMEYDE